MLSVKKFLKKDIKFVFSLQNLKNRKFFLNKKIFSLSSHILWCNSKKRIIYIIYLRRIRVGFVNIKFLRDNFFDLSITIKENYRKKNLASIVISKIEKKYNNHIIRAVVHKKNIASMNLFRGLNYNKKKIVKNFFYFEKLIKF
jgi:hypothetical protein